MKYVRKDVPIFPQTKQTKKKLTSLAGCSKKDFYTEKTTERTSILLVVEEYRKVFQITTEFTFLYLPVFLIYIKRFLVNLSSHC